MPTYEYACQSCDRHIDVVQAFTDDPLTECPTCKGQLRKVFGNVGIVFKGSGFYKTDSRTDSKAKVSTTAASTDKADKKPSDGAGSSSDSPSSEPAAPKAETKDKKESSSNSGPLKKASPSVPAPS